MGGVDGLDTGIIIGMMWMLMRAGAHCSQQRHIPSAISSLAMLGPSPVAPVQRRAGAGVPAGVGFVRWSGADKRQSRSFLGVGKNAAQVTDVGETKTGKDKRERPNPQPLTRGRFQHIRQPVPFIGRYLKMVIENRIKR